MTMKNQDYAYFKIVYYDFPIQDSLSSAIGADFIVVDMEVILRYAKAGDTALTDASFTLQLELSTLGIRNVDQIASEIRSAMNNAMLYKIKTSADQAELNLIKVFFSYVDDFVYDGSTSKLMFVLKVPIGSVQLSLMPNTVDTYLQTVTVVFSDSPTYQTLTETGARLVATLLGGEVIGTTGFQSVFKFKDDSLPVDSKTLFLMGMKAYTTSIQGLYENCDSLSLYSKFASRLYVDQYVYVNGSPEPSMWRSDGVKDSSMAILPRNRGFASGQTIHEGSPSETLERTKTPLNSLRNMTIRLCDRYGKLIHFDEEYCLQIMVYFDID